MPDHAEAGIDARNVPSGGSHPRASGRQRLAAAEPQAAAVPGVRPDGLAATDPDAAARRAFVGLVEHLGRESRLHPDLGDGGELAVEASPDTHHRAEEVVGLAVKPGAARPFATASQPRPAG